MPHALIAKEAFQYKTDRINAAMSGNVLTMGGFLAIFGTRTLDFTTDDHRDHCDAHDYILSVRFVKIYKL